jgi:DUF1680 family protein
MKTTSVKGAFHHEPAFSITTAITRELKMKLLPIPPVSALMFFVGFVVCLVPARAQDDGGDRFLDGIGETSLIARYVFDGNEKDSSRNNHHATLHGTASTFVHDDRFGSVLSLPGKGGGHVEIPGHVLIGVDTISVTGWVFLRSVAPWQRFFDFGQDTTSHCFCTPIGADADEGYRARITSKGHGEEQGPVAPCIKTNRWVHLAVVLDAAQQTLSTYTNGVRVGHGTNVSLNLEQVLDQQNAAANRLYIGKSLCDTDSDINAKIHDFRLYSTALTDEQVATIYRNALSDDDNATTSGPQRPSEAAALPEATGTITMPDALRLIDVPDISVETIVGHLPRLPRTISGTYPNDAEGPELRVIWPSPKDNAQVLQPGTYTVTGRVPDTDFQPRAQVVVKPAPALESTPRRVLEPFPLGQVVLEPDEKRRDTPQIRNRDKFIRGLAATNPDRFLYAFRDAFGQPQPDGVQPLGGWDSQTTKLRGHASGHYLSAIAQAYAGTTYDAPLQATFLRKMDYLIETLYELSQKSGQPLQEGGDFNEDPKTVPPGPGRGGYDSDLSTDGIRHDYWNWGKGFISAYPPDQFIMLEQGATYGGKDDQVWAPYYTLHKILAGLLDCYEVGGNEKALEIARGMGLWVHARLTAVGESTRIRMWNGYIAGEYGGMNEVMARLFRITEDPRFLECTRLFDNIDFFFGNAEHNHGLARNVDTLRGKHANQHIPQITGALEAYRGTRDVQYYRVAVNFWDICTGGYMYSIGGVAGARTPNNAECFTAEPNTLFANGFAAGGQNETCATYNLLKLSRQLFMFDPNGKYMDYYEQALYNHILASVDEDNPGNTYHVPLNPGSRKRFGNANMDGFTCCNGTALESNTKLQDSVYFKSVDKEALYVNLYVPSTVSWPQRNLVVRQQTSFPYSDTTRLTMNGEGDFEIKVRVPRWARRGFHVAINGEQQAVVAVPGTYLSLRRTWKNNDTIELQMPFDFHLCPLMDQPNIASIFYGPVLLAVEEPAPRTRWRRVTLDAANLGKSITGDPGTLRFDIGDIRLKPFCETYDRYSVYFDVTLK